MLPSGYKAGFKKGMKSGELEKVPFLSNQYFKHLVARPYLSGMQKKH